MKTPFNQHLLVEVASAVTSTMFSKPLVHEYGLPRCRVHYPFYINTDSGIDLWLPSSGDLRAVVVQMAINSAIIKISISLGKIIDGHDETINLRSFDLELADPLFVDRLLDHCQSLY